MRHIRAKLVRVAAVACAAVQDLDTGSTAPIDKQSMGPVIDDVISERRRQYRLRGGEHRPAEEWVMLLVEELGRELSQSWRSGKEQP